MADVETFNIKQAVCSYQRAVPREATTEVVNLYCLLLLYLNPLDMTAFRHG